jgi:catechol 2,3-dioxygenase-like lactoylglutathione lyase family enzyme
MKVEVEDRDEEPGGVDDGAPEVIFGDPDGIVLQLQDSSFSGGVGPLGNEHPKAPEPAPTEGLLAVQDFNHITMFVSDQKRSVAFYRELFRMPVDTYQGALPILRVGAGNQFLALVSSPRLRSPAFIHHACFTVKDFDPDRILKGLAEYGVTPRGDKRKQAGPLRSYVTMRMPDRGGAPEGTPELYFTDPDGILLQIQDLRYAGGSGYLGNERGKPRDAPK